MNFIFGYVKNIGENNMSMSMNLTPHHITANIETVLFNHKHYDSSNYLTIDVSETDYSNLDYKRNEFPHPDSCTINHITICDLYKKRLAIVELHILSDTYNKDIVNHSVMNIQKMLGSDIEISLSVYLYNSEQELLKRVIDIIKISPKYICAYNGDNWDFKILKNRASVYGTYSDKKISNILESKKLMDIMNGLIYSDGINSTRRETYNMRSLVDFPSEYTPYITGSIMSALVIEKYNDILYTHISCIIESRLIETGSYKKTLDAIQKYNTPAYYSVLVKLKRLAYKEVAGKHIDADNILQKISSIISEWRKLDTTELIGILI